MLVCLLTWKETLLSITCNYSTLYHVIKPERWRTVYPHLFKCHHVSYFICLHSFLRIIIVIPRTQIYINTYRYCLNLLLYVELAETHQAIACEALIHINKNREMVCVCERDYMFSTLSWPSPPAPPYSKLIKINSFIFFLYLKSMSFLNPTTAQNEQMSE